MVRLLVLQVLRDGVDLLHVPLDQSPVVGREIFAGDCHRKHSQQIGQALFQLLGMAGRARRPVCSAAKLLVDIADRD